MARIKKCFTREELPRVWLRQSQPEGHTVNERMWFQGDTIYSYGDHFPIARIFTAPNGETVILFTTRTYSTTTAKHIAAVRSAVYNSSKRVVYCTALTPSHLENMVNFKREFDNIAEKHNKARKPELYGSSVLNEARMAREYCEVMLLPVPLWAQLPGDLPAGAALTAAMLVHTEERTA